MKTLFLSYGLCAIVGLGVSRGLHEFVFSQMADDGLFLCFVLGTIFSLIVFLICLRRISSCAGRVVIGAVLGFWSYLPGYVIAIGYGAMNI